MLLCWTISSMMGLTSLGKQSSTQGFDKHVTYLELQARKAITALETVKCCELQAKLPPYGEADQVADYMNLVLNFGFISMPGTKQCMAR